MSFEDHRGEAEERIGTVLSGRWRLVRPIAVGGSAWVYIAADTKVGGPAAVKVLHRALAEHSSIVQRFLREARIPKAIGHRGVVEVTGEGWTSDNVPFFAMELLDGETLEARRERKGGRLLPREVMWAMDEVLGVLVAAHKKEILHRDVKPENVYLTNTHAIKLLDFGIARSVERHEDDDPSESTRIGSVMGTLDYMPPEQGRGDWSSVGVTTDLWAVGATMWTLLTGRSVHVEDDILSQMEAIKNNPAPPMRMVAPDVPAPVQVLVDQALQFDAARRWSNASAMRIALRLAYRTMKDGTPDSENEDIVRIPRPPMYVAPSIPPLSRRPQKP